MFEQLPNVQRRPEQSRMCPELGQACVTSALEESQMSKLTSLHRELTTMQAVTIQNHPKIAIYHYVKHIPCVGSHGCRGTNSYPQKNLTKLQASKQGYQVAVKLECAANCQSVTAPSVPKQALMNPVMGCTLPPTIIEADRRGSKDDFPLWESPCAIP